MKCIFVTNKDKKLNNWQEVPSFEKCYVKNGGIVVDKLKEVHFDGERLLVVCVGLVQFFFIYRLKNNSSIASGQIIF